MVKTVKIYVNEYGHYYLRIMHNDGSVDWYNVVPMISRAKEQELEDDLNAGRLQELK